MNNRRSLLRTFFVLIAFGVMCLLAMYSRNVLANIRTVYIVQLLGAGMCFGGAIFVLASYFRGNQSS